VTKLTEAIAEKEEAHRKEIEEFMDALERVTIEQQELRN
jgi:hypothetical protein